MNRTTLLLLITSISINSTAMDNSQLMQLASIAQLQSFQEKFINKNHFPIDDALQRSLHNFIPDTLSQWYFELKSGHQQLPVLLYGARGIGKTITAHLLA